jgi:hypothetical protein
MPIEYIRNNIKNIKEKAPQYIDNTKNKADGFLRRSYPVLKKISFSSSIGAGTGMAIGTAVASRLMELNPYASLVTVPIITGGTLLGAFVGGVSYSTYHFYQKIKTKKEISNGIERIIEGQIEE